MSSEMQYSNQMVLPGVDVDAVPRAAAGDGLTTVQNLAAAAWDLARHGALAELSESESLLLGGIGPLDTRFRTDELVEQVREGADPLGEAFTRIRPAQQRRLLGATYTPCEIVSSMVAWVGERAEPLRIVDPGTGSARFLLAAGRAFPQASLVGVEIDPLAALVARANLTAAGFDNRSRVVVGDYRTAALGDCGGTTAYLGNPPYVRHHQIEPAGKKWLAESAVQLGLRANGLAGLHAHFLVATALHARPGDIGSFVTSAEWLDVNYGSLLRELVATQLGGVSVHIVDPQASPFGDAATTAAVTCFEVGTEVTDVRMKRVPDATALGTLTDGRRLPRQRLRAASRWTPLLNKAPEPPVGYVELGELCRVHRGAVTGANRTWITDASNPALPQSALFPAITRARELIDAPDGELSTALGLLAVIDLPSGLDVFDTADRARIDRFLRSARREGVHTGYVARHRSPWWSVRLREPAPILATYMARRPPTFVRNTAAVRHINVAHGIYPREPLTAATLDALAAALRAAAPTAVGRTYAGGLIKFEPSEMARIYVPAPEMLEAMAA
ncbi:MAG: N-6 DNA methylase [Acidimicrobiaceae bacterium]|nr:N-6 DNA methylase [Acidimicrobiaceae bacterium]